MAQGTKIEVKVRVSETDLLGHVNNASYFIYIEDARVEFLKNALPNREVDDNSYIVASVRCDFIQQAYFGQTLVINTMVSKIGNSSFELLHEMSDKETGQLIAKGESVVVHFNFDKQKSEQLTNETREHLTTLQTS